MAQVPSGTSSLVLGDFASPLLAVGQRINQQMIEKYEQDKTKKSQDRAVLMKALSFDAVAGLGRKVQEEHLNKLNALKDKWAQRYLANDMKLSDMDYFELQKDQQKTEQEVANMKFDVAQYALAQKEMLKPNAKWLYEGQSLINADNYLKEGRVGEGRAANILVPRMDIPGYLKDSYSAKLNEIKVDKVPEIAGKRYRIIETNRAAVDEQKAAAEKDPLIAEKLKDPVYRAQFDNFFAGVLHEKSGYEPMSGSDYDMYTGQRNKPSLTEQRRLANYNQFNEIADRIWSYDQDAMDRMKGTKYSSVNKRTDGSIYLKGKKPEDSISIPPPGTDDFSKQTARMKVLEFVYPNAQGDAAIQIDLIDPNYKSEKEITPATSIETQYLEDQFSGTPGDIRKVKEKGVDGKEKTVEYPRFKIADRERLIEEMKKVYPDDEFSTESIAQWGVNKSKGYPFYWTPKGGEMETYNLKDPNDIKKIKEKIRERNEGSAKPGILD